jgi:hypothetical protein
MGLNDQDECSSGLKAVLIRHRQKYRLVQRGEEVLRMDSGDNAERFYIP